MSTTGLDLSLLLAELHILMPDTEIIIYPTLEAYAATSQDTRRERKDRWISSKYSEKIFAENIYKFALRGTSAWSLPVEADDIPPDDLFVIFVNSYARGIRKYRLESTRFPDKHKLW
jgi:hypothetical protein